MVVGYEQSVLRWKQQKDSNWFTAFSKRTEKKAQMLWGFSVSAKGDSKTQGNGVPVKEKTTASNGLDYKSNPKHTPGQPGNRPNAGIEPKNSLDLFGDSVPSTSKPN